MRTVPHSEAISKISRPAGMHADTWRRMKILLRMLSGYGDEIYPTQRTLARRMGTSQQVVQQLVVRAVTLGYISREDRPLEGGWRPGTTYQILLTRQADRQGDQTRNLSKKEEPPSGVLRVSSSSRKRGCLAAAAPPPKRTSSAERMGLVRPNRYHGRCYACHQPIRPREGILHGPHPIHPGCVRRTMDRKWQREHSEDLHSPTALGSDREAPLPVHSPPPTNPAARLARSFQDQWFHEVIPRYPQWRQHQWGQAGPAIGYITTQFLRNGYSPAYVEAYFNAFFTDLLDGSSPLRPRDGQSAWQLFTGVWGRYQVPDPAIAQARQAARDAVSAVLREGTSLRKAAQDRVVAAQEQGLEPDPDDVKIALGMA